MLNIGSLFEGGYIRLFSSYPLKEQNQGDCMSAVQLQRQANLLPHVIDEFSNTTDMR